MKTIFALITDPYDRQARLIPGLLVILPVLVPLIAVYGPKHPILTSILSLLSTCGAVYALASIARGRGKKLEELLIKEWGGMPTTIILRHQDTFLDSISKSRYHDAITAKLGIAMPTAQEEAENPAKADDTYIGATKRLREVTRSNKKLLFKENIAYGFHRNMLAMKTAGIFTCICGVIYGLLISQILVCKAPYFVPVNLTNVGLATGLTLLISLALLAAWIFYFDKDAVRRIGLVYAERLFECLPSLPGKRNSKSSATSTNSSN